MTLKLEAKTRKDLGKKAELLRQSGKIPAVIYGHGKENQNLEVDYIKFEKVLNEAGESTLVDVSIDGGTSVKTIIADVQREPVKGRIIHADLHQVNMKEKINANVQIEFTGESKAVKEDGGVLIHNISEVEIHCLPGDLIPSIIVDISSLNALNDTITIKDLKIPNGVEILHHEPEDVVALVAAPKEEKEEVSVVAPTEGEGEAAPTAEAEKKEE